jgi:hypothetical protein
VNAHDGLAREELHHRSIDLRFFRRSDGLFEVEGRLVDTKSHPFRRLLAEKDAPPGQHLHDITVRLVLDAELQVRAADADMRATPFGICPGAAGALQSPLARKVALPLPEVSRGRPFVKKLDVYKVGDKVFMIITDGPDGIAYIYSIHDYVSNRRRST